MEGEERGWGGVGHNLVWGSGRQKEGVPMAASKVWSRASR